ncbi:MAG: rod shape-determining protein MreC [Minisyncoccia bacterium]|jgi:cell shape-determining protein MreC
MKRTFLVKRNALFSSTGVSWGALALACALIVLLVRLLAPNFFWYAVAPVFKSANAFATTGHSFFTSFSNVSVLASRNEQLVNENAALANENQTLSQKVADISALFSSQSTKGNTPLGILAGVVARPPESPYDTLVLAAGKNAGVVAGMEVFGSGGVPLGIVSSVLADFSRATLFSAPGASTAGWIGTNNMPLTISGGGAGAMNATAARSANIKVGDTVFVPGPGMLPIGTVTRIESDPSSPSVTLRIQPMLNPFSIAWVTVRDTGSALLFATSTFL